MLCLAAGALAATLAVDAFTLLWVHSVQKSEIQEDYRLVQGHVVLTEARIKGSAAGFDPPPGSRLAGGWWHYVPDLPPLSELRLARSETVADWQLCVAGTCRPLSDHLPSPSSPSEAQRTAPVTLQACTAGR